MPSPCKGRRPVFPPIRPLTSFQRISVLTISILLLLHFSNLLQEIIGPFPFCCFPLSLGPLESGAPFEIAARLAPTPRCVVSSMSSPSRILPLVDRKIPSQTSFLAPLKFPLPFAFRCSVFSFPCCAAEKLALIAWGVSPLKSSPFSAKGSSCDRRPLTCHRGRSRSQIFFSRS